MGNQSINGQSSRSSETTYLIHAENSTGGYHAIQMEQLRTDSRLLTDMPRRTDADFGPDTAFAEFCGSALGMVAGAAIGGVVGWLSATDGNERNSMVIGEISGGGLGAMVGMALGTKLGYSLWERMDLAGHARQLLDPLSSDSVKNWGDYQKEPNSGAFAGWLKSMHESPAFANNRQDTMLRLQTVMARAEQSDELRARFFEIGVWAMSDPKGRAEHALGDMELEMQEISTKKWRSRDLAGHAAYLLGNVSSGREERWSRYGSERNGDAFTRWLQQMIETKELRQNPHGVMERLATLMEAADDNRALRKMLFNLAGEFTGRCEDRAAQGLNEMELALEDFRLTNSGASTGEFMNAGAAKLRSVILKQESQRLAHENGLTDDVDVHLYLVEQLADSLELPDQVRSSQWGYSVVNGTRVPTLVDSVKANVLQYAAEPSTLKSFLVEKWRPWEKHLKREKEQCFKSILETARTKEESIGDGSSFKDLPLDGTGEISMDAKPEDIDPVRYEAYLNWRVQSGNIKNYYDQSEKDLIEKLTTAYVDEGSFDTFDFNQWNQQYVGGFPDVRQA